MIDIKALSPSERLELIELLWDSRCATPDGISADKVRARLSRVGGA